MTAGSIRTKLNWLVALSLSPVFGWGAILVLLDAYGFGQVPASAAEAVRSQPLLWGWLIVSATILVGGLVVAERLARQLTFSVAQLADAADRLARGQPVTLPSLPVKEADKVSASLVQVGSVLNDRTAERDRASRAERLLRSKYAALETRAAHDALTGLSNRAHFDAELAQRIAAREREGGQLAVLFIDIDGFKPINDRHGHAIGDELLRHFAARLRAGVRQREVVARIGGDEFAVLIDPATQGLACRTGESLLDRLSQPYCLGEMVLEVSASIGIAVYPLAGDSAQALLDAADQAMYCAKRGGKGRTVTSGFTPL
jgi:diguanylate cyclase (GGDEF)-like protein